VNEMELLTRLRDEVPAEVIPARAETALRTAIQAEEVPASSAVGSLWARGHWRAASWKRHRWPGWVAPLAAAAAVAAVIVGTQAVLNAIHGRGAPPPGRAWSTPLPPTSPTVHR
jgi:negative regulator of sigma E activity